MDIDYSGLPAHVQTGLRAYIENHIRRGGFLTACLENNFVEAALRADPIARKSLWAIARFLYNEAPSDCWGSREKVKAWVKTHPG